MRLEKHSHKSLGNLLILLGLLQCVAIYWATASDVQLSFSRNKLITSKGSQSSKNRLTDPLQFADDSLITRSPKSNKVSKLLHLIHHQAEDVIYHRNKLQHVKSEQASEDEPLIVPAQYESKELAPMSDDNVVQGVCGQLSSRTCKLAAKIVLKAKPEEKAVIANAIRHRPAYVDPVKLLYHKLFEFTIAKTEEKNIDKTLDLGINLLAKKNPYGWAAIKAIDIATKAG